MTTTLIQKDPTTRRAQRLLSRVRQRQLALARRGHLMESFKYAQRAERIRRAQTPQGIADSSALS